MKQVTGNDYSVPSSGHISQYTRSSLVDDFIDEKIRDSLTG